LQEAPGVMNQKDFPGQFDKNQVDRQSPGVLINQKTRRDYLGFQKKP